MSKALDFIVSHNLTLNEMMIGGLIILALFLIGLTLWKIRRKKKSDVVDVDYCINEDFEAVEDVNQELKKEDDEDRKDNMQNM